METLSQVAANAVSTTEEATAVDRLLIYYSDWQKLTHAIGLVVKV